MEAQPPLAENQQSNDSTENTKNDINNTAMETSESQIEVKTVTEDLLITDIKTEEGTENESDLYNIQVEIIKSEPKLSDDNSDSKPKEPKRAKRKRCRPLKRTRKHKINKTDAVVAHKVEDNDTGDDPDTSIDVKDDVEYCLTVSNFAKGWSFMDIKNFIDTECGPVDEIEMVKDEKTGNGAIRLSFQTEKECKTYMEKLRNKKIDENQLSLEMTVVSLESDSEVPETSKPPTQIWRPDLDSWEIDRDGMYGLKLSFLKSLKINPPLDKWVHVSNFRCDKAELRDVLELAGAVLMCTVYCAAPRYANVMYSHPLEAVQAVSMLNEQTFYGQQLKVTMNKIPPHTVFLPKGLTSIGKGLGMKGKPLRNIVKHYERFVDNKESSINTVFFDIPANHSMEISEAFEFRVQSIDELKNVAEEKVTTTTVTSTVTTTTVQSKPKVAVTKTVSKPAVTPKTNFTPQQRANNNGNFRPPFQSNNMNGNSGPIRPLLGPGPNVPFQGPGFRGPGFHGPGPRPGWGPGPMNGPPHPGPMGPMGPRPMGHGHMGPNHMGQMDQMGQMGAGMGHMGQMGGQIGPMGGQMGPMGGQMGPMGGQMGPMGGQMGQMGGPMGQMGGQIGQMGGQMDQMGAGMGQMGPSGPVNSVPTPALVGPGPIAPPGTFGTGIQKPFANPNEPVKLSLSNLPPTTTFAVLCEKMSEWGHVVSIQLTTPGCAVVTFANRMQADACSNYYNGRKIDNHFIQVSYA